MSGGEPLDPFGAFEERWPADPGTLRLAVKDMIGVAGAGMTAGIPARRGTIAERDAAVVEAARSAGWSIVGTTVSDAAGFGTMTPAVTHPRVPGRAVGGSSGGAAAALAAGLADVALGTDTGGSVRIPAAYCDLYAFKPTNGRIDGSGVLPLSMTFDVVGILSRTPQTLKSAAQRLIKGEETPAALGRVSVFADDEALMDPSLAGLWATTSAGLPRLDEPSYEAMASAHSTIVCAEALAVHREDWQRAPEAFPEMVRSALNFGAQLTSEDIARAHERIAETRRAFSELLAPGDLLVRPTLAIPPAPRKARDATLAGRRVPVTDANIRLTTFANAARLPVLVVPAGPLSLQIVGAEGTDALVLSEGFALAERLSALAAGGSGGAGHRD